MQMQWRQLVPEPVLALAGWLNTWRGIGAILDGMTAQGFELELIQQVHGWWAWFYPTGPSHVVCAGSGWAVTPWAAVQAGARDTLTPKARPDFAMARSEQPRDTRDGAGAVCVNGVRAVNQREKKVAA